MKEKELNFREIVGTAGFTENMRLKVLSAHTIIRDMIRGKEESRKLSDEVFLNDFLDGLFLYGALVSNETKFNYENAISIDGFTNVTITIIAEDTNRFLSQMDFMEKLLDFKIQSTKQMGTA